MKKAYFVIKKMDFIDNKIKKSYFVIKKIDFLDNKMKIK